jgi:hypothetical protein
VGIASYAVMPGKSRKVLLTGSSERLKKACVLSVRPMRRFMAARLMNRKWIEKVNIMTGKRQSQFGNAVLRS